MSKDLHLHGLVHVRLLQKLLHWLWPHQLRPVRHAEVGGLLLGEIRGTAGKQLPTAAGDCGEIELGLGDVDEELVRAKALVQKAGACCCNRCIQVAGVPIAQIEERHHMFLLCDVSEYSLRTL